MKLEMNTCYSRILYMLNHGKLLSAAVNKVEYTSPDLKGEGFNGYISTDVVFHITDLEKFTKLYYKWFELDQVIKDRFYKLASTNNENTVYS